MPTSADQPKDPTPEAPPTWRDLLPWEGKPGRGDKILLGFLVGVPLFYLVLLPVRPFLIAEMPVVLEVVTGARTAVGAAGAYARVGEFPLWLVIVAGTIGMAKFDWLFWLAGARWGPRIVALFTPDRRTRRAEQLKRLPAWLLWVLVFLGRFPAVPGPLVWLIAGWSGMRLRSFLLADVLGAAALSTMMAGLGFAVGQRAVDFVELIDSYAIWVSIAIVVGLAVVSSRKASPRSRPAGRTASQEADGPAEDDR